MSAIPTSFRMTQIPLKIPELGFGPQLGFGLGLRPKHYPHIFEHKPKVDWFEIISENFMDTDGKPRRNLERILENYPVVMHGVALSIGTVDPLNSEYLKKLKNLMGWVKPAWISDHLCWTGVAHRNTHDLLPLPYTEEALAHIVDRIKRVQDYLGQEIALENPSTYLEFKSSSMPEAEFISRMAEQSACRLLLDVNNVYVTCFNHRLDPKTYIDILPLDRVVQIHLAGHDNKGTHIVDTHDSHVTEDVWALYKYTINKAGRVPNTMIEWDDRIPEFDVLYAELQKARITAASTQNPVTLPSLLQASEINVVSKPLASEQSKMQTAILTGVEEDPESWIRVKAQFPAKAQLGVYINAYRYRLFDAVAEDYPVLAHYLGSEKFKKLIWSFIEAVPSGHFNIGRYAAKLPDFTQKELSSDVLAQEICMLETALTQLADAEETLPLAAEKLSNLMPEELMQAILRPRKALQLMKLSYPVNRYYREVMEEKNPSPPEKEEIYLAIFRHDDVMWRAELEKDEHRLLEKLFSGMSVGDALADLDEASATKLSDWFSRWMHHRLLSKIKVEKIHVAA